MLLSDFLICSHQKLGSLLVSRIISGTGSERECPEVGQGRPSGSNCSRLVVEKTSVHAALASRRGNIFEYNQGKDPTCFFKLVFPRGRRKQVNSICQRQVILINLTILATFLLCTLADRSLQMPAQIDHVLRIAEPNTETTQYPSDNNNNNMNLIGEPNPQPDDENDDFWVDDTNARQEVANFLFNEFREQNFQPNLTKFNSPLVDLSAALGYGYSSPGLSQQSYVKPFAFDSISSNMGNNINEAVLFASQANILEGQSAGLPIETRPAQNGTLLTLRNNTSGLMLSSTGQSRPYFGDALQYFQSVYWPIHCVLCLVICTLGIFANLTNIIVLTRPNMVTAVNTILSAMAFTDLIVNISTIPYIIHELSDTTNSSSFHSFQWAVYILIHAHTSVTAHTISIWLTCALATWRYFVVCRSQSSNQRIWSVTMAKRTIIGVLLFVPCFSIPNYLCFAIVKDVSEKNETIYRVGFSQLAEESDFIKTFHFWIFSCLTKLLPCVLLSFFTTCLIRKLLSARERRLRLATFGQSKQPGKEYEENQLAAGPLANGAHLNPCGSRFGSVRAADRKVDAEAPAVSRQQPVLIDGRADGPEGDKMMIFNEHCKGAHHQERSDKDVKGTADAGPYPSSRETFNLTIHALGNNNSSNHQFSGSSNVVTENELIKNSLSCSSNLSDGSTGNQQPRILSQLIVENNDTNNTTSISSTKMLASHGKFKDQSTTTTTKQNYNTKASSNFLAPADEQRPASTCGTSEFNTSDNNHNRPLILSSMTASQELPNNGSGDTSRQKSTNQTENNFFNCSTNNYLNPSGGGVVSSSSGILPRVGGSSINFKSSDQKRCSETIFNGLSKSTNDINNNRNRSFGSSSLNPIHIVKIHASQKQLGQNETTTRLLIAVMIVFLICEFPAGILAALCAILGQDFWENVYHPMGTVTDLLALINSSVNFILYCFMSTQFRITFYRVVLRCPAPSMPQQRSKNRQYNIQNQENFQQQVMND